MKISLGVKLIHPPGVLTLIVSIFLFILSILLIGQNLDKPFWGVHDWNGVRYGNIARNYFRYGLFETKLGQVENSGPAKPDEFEYYTHYPPLLPIVISISYSIFGISEFSTRLIPLLATAGSIVLIFLIGFKLYNLKIGITAALLALATPMVQYFGKNASHEGLTLFFILVSFYGYISLGKEKWAKFLFVAGLILAQMTAWAGFFLIPSLTLMHLLRKEFGQAKSLVPYWILSIFLFSIHLIHINLLTGSFGGGKLFESLFQRTGILSDAQPQGFNLPNYLNQLRLWFSTLYTLTLTILALLGVRNYGWPIFSLGMVGVIYASLFSSSVFIHNYLIFYFLPFLSLAGTRTIFWIKENYDRLVYHSGFKKPYLKFISNFIIVFFLGLIFFERYNFLTALNISQPDKLAVEVGRAINQSSKAGDTVLVSPVNFSYSADKFLRFYSDRKLVYSDDDSLKYAVRVIVDQDRGKFEIMQVEDQR